MEQRLFGPTGAKVPVIGQGTWYIDEENRKQAIAAIREGLDLGMKHIDTAEMYGFGEAENIVGEAIEGRRDEVFLVSKVLPENATRAGTVNACNLSLERLRTDHLDCYLLHWRGAHPLRETVAGFRELLKEGKILSWGVSNFDVPDLEELAKAAKPGEIACNQCLYHLQERTVEYGVIPWCTQNNVAFTAYSPFGHGQFPARNPVLKEIAIAHGATPRQVALRFLLRWQGSFTIPKASRREHVTENAFAGDLRLSEEEIQWIDEAFPVGPKLPKLAML